MFNLEQLLLYNVSVIILSPGGNAHYDKDMIHHQEYGRTTNGHCTTRNLKQDTEICDWGRWGISKMGMSGEGTCKAAGGHQRAYSVNLLVL